MRAGNATTASSISSSSFRMAKSGQDNPQQPLSRHHELEEDTWSQSSLNTDPSNALGNGNGNGSSNGKRTKSKGAKQKRGSKATSMDTNEADEEFAAVGASTGDGNQGNGNDSDTDFESSSSSKWVQKMVFVAVIGLGVFCCLSTFLVLRNMEEDRYNDQFDDVSTDFLSNAHAVSNSIASSTITLSATTTSYALQQQSQSQSQSQLLPDSDGDGDTTPDTSFWPYVFVPHFQQRTDQLHQQLASLSQYPSTDGNDSSSNNNNSTSAEIVYAPLVLRSNQPVYEGWVLNQYQQQQQAQAQAQAQQQPTIVPYIFRRDEATGEAIRDDGGIDTYFVPILQSNAAQDSETSSSRINENLFSFEFSKYFLYLQKNQPLSLITIQQQQQQQEGEVHFVAPTYDTFDDDEKSIAGIVMIRLRTESFVAMMVDDNDFGKMQVDVEDTCTKSHTFYSIDGDRVVKSIDSISSSEDQASTVLRTTTTSLSSSSPADLASEYCPIAITIHATNSFHSEYRSNKPIIFTVILATLFLLLIVLIARYDYVYQKQQNQVLQSAQQSHDFISSLFPAQFRDRLLLKQQRDNKQQESHPSNNLAGSSASNAIANSAGAVSSSLERPFENGSSKIQVNKPIAELFIQCTVMFADIAGFTAWSSQREPAEVFTLLESVYSAFDAIAKRQRIFKVETIGDCYVAVAGLPERREDHAEAMAKFANACRRRMNQVVKKLEVILGPDTADLSMRFGLHSGPVTAGVLRGDKSRFQLFGDTVNTACRIESTGARDRIHLSEETANILIAKDKRHWVSPRETLVEVKGKGMMQTWWLIYDQTDLKDPASTNPRRSDKSQSNLRYSSIQDDGPNDPLSRNHGSDDDNDDDDDSDDDSDLGDDSSIDIGYSHDGAISSSSSSSSSSSLGSDVSADSIDEKTMRLVEWNVDIMAQQLKKITAMRESSSATTIEDADDLVMTELKEGTMLEEVREIINLSTQTKQYKRDPDDIDLGEAVVYQLQDYVREISKLYNNNPFHSFEHASHVTQSVAKLLARVVTPDSIDYQDMCYKKQAGEAQLHEYTYGITSDPLIHFACIYSALIHDVDHSGLPNADLIRWNRELADRYKEKSVAEQNSVDLSWELLMEPRFVDLRSCIYRNQEEMDRFRQLVVNSVMATDIADKELGALRRKRWEKAFDQNAMPNDTPETQRDSVNRKATIVIEHLIQASDISHTMQHWHVYRKWNEKLFHEMYKAYIEGKSEKDPSIGWYEGELGFYDFYIIPLAKKLKECGCFGVSSDEYLQYAQANRSEWQLKGWEIVRGYMTKYRHTAAAAAPSGADSNNNLSPNRNSTHRTETLGSQDLVKFLMANHNQQQGKK